MGQNRYNRTYYNYGSAAPEIYTEAPKSPRMPNTKRRKKLQKQRKEDRLFKFKKRLNLSLSIGVMFIASVAFVWGCAVISQKQYELETAKTEIQALKSQVNTKKSLIASATNLDNIKDRAINELNMTEPLAHQIILLDIAKTSYTILE